jgi:hypothetical protein
MLPEHILSEVEHCCAIRLVQVADGFGHGLGCSERLLADLPELEAFEDIEYWLHEVYGVLGPSTRRFTAPATHNAPFG